MGFFSSVVSGIKKVVRAVGGAIGQGLRIIATVGWRFLGSGNFFLGLIGIRPRKKLHIRVVILKDENGDFLKNASGEILTPMDVVMANIDLAKSIFKQQANVDIIAVDGVFVKVNEIATPKAALEVGCNSDAWLEDFGEAGDFFRENSAVIFPRSLHGYGSPITAFIVRDVKNKKGCSLGPLTNYVTVDTKGFYGPVPTDDVVPAIIPSKILAHEIAHSCGLRHRDGGTTLMNPDDETGTRLTRFQKSWLRNSRHVTYL